MLPNENITQMYNRFSNIIVGLSSLGKILTNEETVRKILRSLTHVWTPTVTAIEEAHDLTQLSIDKLIGTLMAHEINMERFSESSSKKKMPNALKVADSSSSEDLKEKSDDSDDEAMLSRKLQIILAKKKKFGSKRFFRKDKKKGPTYYECNQPKHYKSECPKLKKKDQAERSEKKKGKEKKFKKYKKKAMAAAWDNEEATCSDSSSSESEKEEKANLALMAGLDQVNSETSFTSYSESDSDKKSNTFLKNEVERLGQNLNETKRSNELLCEDLKNKNSKITEIESNLRELNDEEKLREKNNYLRATIDKISNCKTSLFVRLKGARSGKKKYRARYTPPTNEENIIYPEKYPTPKFVKEKEIKNPRKVKQYVYKQKLNSRNTTHVKNAFDLCCSHCNHLGHTVSTCTTRHLCWIPKTNHQGPKKIWVPKVTT
ncbi:hypothetical protein Taro_030137 [Colocasia esculenta]|uniref:UBN2 domain-containing protein n=1 Tax=Colocasia esculenta TaxID=4460 RepID=A0A843VKP4_COLES|nr:hypothetical protein [Colocasia esculenta]